MFATIDIDNWTTEQLRYLAPHFGAFKLSGPREIGGNMPLPKPVVASAVNYLYNYDDKRADPDKSRRMRQMFTIKEL